MTTNPLALATFTDPVTVLPQTPSRVPSEDRTLPRIVELRMNRAPPAAPCTVPPTVALTTQVLPLPANTAFGTEPVMVLVQVTVWVVDSRLPARKLPSPLYCAVMVCVPGSRFEELACVRLQFVPPPGESVPAPRSVLPSRKVTVPVGGETGLVLPSARHTVSVKVAAWPNADGPADTRVVVTGALSTVWTRGCRTW